MTVSPRTNKWKANLCPSPCVVLCHSPEIMAAGFLIEVCVDSVESAVNAERGGLYSEHWFLSTNRDGIQHI